MSFLLVLHFYFFFFKVVDQISQSILGHSVSNSSIFQINVLIQSRVLMIKYLEKLIELAINFYNFHQVHIWLNCLN